MFAYLTLREIFLVAGLYRHAKWMRYSATYSLLQAPLTK
jgi:hypothetical protein